MYGACTICTKDSNVIICKACQKKACGECMIKFTSDNTFIHRKCLCGEKYTVDDLYDSLGDSFMRDSYINTMVQMKIKKFEDSFDILENYMKTDEKYKIANEELCNLQSQYFEYTFTSNHKKLKKVLIKINKKETEIKEYRDNNRKNLGIFDNTLEEFESFFEEDENLDHKYTNTNNTIMKYRARLQNCDFADNVKSTIDDNLLSISDSFLKIYKIQEACGNFRRNKELNRYRTKTSLIRLAIDCKVKKTISDDKFAKIVKNSEIISERVDTVLEYVRYNWQNIENIRIKATKVFQEAKSFNFEEENNAIKKIVDEIVDLADGTDVMKKMKTRFNMTEEEIVDYWTTSIPTENIQT